MGPTGTAASRAASTVARGAPDMATTIVIGTAQRSTRAVTTIVKTALSRRAPAMPEAYRRAASSLSRAYGSRRRLRA